MLVLEVFGENILHVMGSTPVNASEVRTSCLVVRWLFRLLLIWINDVAAAAFAAVADVVATAAVLVLVMVVLQKLLLLVMLLLLLSAASDDRKTTQTSFVGCSLPFLAV